MIVRIDRSFVKDTDKIKDQKVLNKIASCIISVQKASSATEIKNVKKLKGAAFHFRIRIDEFRIGVEIKNNEVFFERCLHRKDIYKYFPKK
jgi:mRNA interferase RelE/StbE